MISWYQAKDHRWRDAYNPLRGLSMPKLVSLLEAGERGQYADLQWFYHYMEQSDAMIAAVLQRRRAALLSVDWDIRLAAGRDEGGNLKAEREKATTANGANSANGEYDAGLAEEHPPSRKAAAARHGRQVDGVLAEEQRDFLREAYDRIDNFRDAVGFLFTGIGRGFAHVEKHYGASGLVERLEPVEQPSSRLRRYAVPWWFWIRDGMFGDWEYNENAVSGRRKGIPIERDDFVIWTSRSRWRRRAGC